MGSRPEFWTVSIPAASIVTGRDDKQTREIDALLPDRSLPSEGRGGKGGSSYSAALTSRSFETFLRHQVLRAPFPHLRGTRARTRAVAFLPVSAIRHDPWRRGRRKGHPRRSPASPHPCGAQRRSSPVGVESSSVPGRWREPESVFAVGTGSEIPITGLPRGDSLSC